MEFNRQNIRSKAGATEAHVIDEGLRSYMLKVYVFWVKNFFNAKSFSLRKRYHR